MLAWLTKRGFTESERFRAELWILEGDWTTKGVSPRLESGDFVPTEKQWRVRDDLVVMLPAEFQVTLREHYDRGRNDERADRLHQRMMTAAPSPISQDVREAFDLIKRNAALEEENAAMRGKLAELQSSGAMDWRWKYEQETVAHAATRLTADEDWTEVNLFVKRLFLDEGYFKAKRGEYMRENPSARLGIAGGNTLKRRKDKSSNHAG